MHIVLVHLSILLIMGDSMDVPPDHQGKTRAGAFDFAADVPSS
jgi:hypothetical protein